MAGLKAVLGRIWPAPQRGADVTEGIGFRRRGFRGVGCVFVHGFRIPNNRGLVETGVDGVVAIDVAIDAAIDAAIDDAPYRSEK